MASLPAFHHGLLVLGRNLDRFARSLHCSAVAKRELREHHWSIRPIRHFTHGQSLGLLRECEEALGQVEVHSNIVPSADLSCRYEVRHWLHQKPLYGSLQMPSAISHIDPLLKQERLSLLG